MPARACKPADIAELVGEPAALLLLLAADNADLVSELAALLRQGVDVKARRLWLSNGNVYLVKKQQLIEMNWVFRLHIHLPRSTGGRIPSSVEG